MQKPQNLIIWADMIKTALNKVNINLNSLDQSVIRGAFINKNSWLLQARRLTLHDNFLISRIMTCRSNKNKKYLQLL